MRIWVYVLGTIAAVTLSLSVLFKLLHLSGADMLLMMGMLIFSLGFTPLAARYLYLKRRKNSDV